MAAEEAGLAAQAARRSWTRLQVRWGSQWNGAAIRIQAERSGCRRVPRSRAEGQATRAGRQGRRRLPMIAHVVLFSPSPSLGAEQKSAILQGLTQAVRQCPTVRTCRIGRRIRHGLPGYEQRMREDFQYYLLLEFDDVEGLRAYLGHPAHAAIGGFFTSAASASLAYDYEVVELEEAKGLL